MVSSDFDERHLASTRLQVFSANEDLEEISTEVLPLLAADFYLGSLITKLPFNSPEVGEVTSSILYTDHMYQ